MTCRTKRCVLEWGAESAIAARGDGFRTCWVANRLVVDFVAILGTCLVVLGREYGTGLAVIAPTYGEGLVVTSPEYGAGLFVAGR